MKFTVTVKQLKNKVIQTPAYYYIFDNLALQRNWIRVEESDILKVTADGNGYKIETYPHFGVLDGAFLGNEIPAEEFNQVFSDIFKDIWDSYIGSVTNGKMRALIDEFNAKTF